MSSQAVPRLARGAFSLHRRLLLTSPGRLPSSFRAMLAAAAVLVAAIDPAAAQVMEIARDGSVSWKHGAADSAGVRDLAVAPAALPAAAVTAFGGLDVPAHYAGIIEQVAAAADISPALLAAVVWQESRWRHQAVSPKGAIGLGQLMPATARELGVDPTDPAANLLGAARYLRLQLNRFGGDVERALAAYNAGPGRVQRAGGIPRIAETQAYVASVVRRISSIRSQGE